MTDSELNYAAFAGCINSAFSVKMGDAEEGNEPITLDLIEAAEIKQSDVNETALVGFTLMFKGSVQQMLPDGTHEFSHEKLGSAEIFISACPNEGDPKAIYYEAVFNNIEK